MDKRDNLNELKEYCSEIKQYIDTLKQYGVSNNDSIMLYMQDNEEAVYTIKAIEEIGANLSGVVGINNSLSSVNNFANMVRPKYILTCNDTYESMNSVNRNYNSQVVNVSRKIS